MVLPNESPSSHDDADQLASKVLGQSVANPRSEFYLHLQRKVLALYTERQSFIGQNFKHLGKEVGDDRPTNDAELEKDQYLLSESDPLGGLLTAAQEVDESMSPLEFWNGVNRYIESDESTMYSRLLDLRRKLEYEIEYLKEMATDSEPLKVHADPDLKDNRTSIGEESKLQEEQNTRDETVDDKADTDEQPDTDEGSDSDEESGIDEESDANEATQEATRNDTNAQDQGRDHPVESRSGEHVVTEVNENDAPTNDIEDESVEAKWVVIHRVYCTDQSWTTGHDSHGNINQFLDPPQIRTETKTVTKFSYSTLWKSDYERDYPEEKTTLWKVKGEKPLESLEDYLAKHPSVLFVFYKDYHCQSCLSFVEDLSEGKTDESYSSTWPVPQCVREEVVLTSEIMKDSMSALKTLLPSINFVDWWKSDKMEEPFLPLYHYSDAIVKALDDTNSSFTTEQQECTSALTDFVHEHLKPKFDTTRSLLERGLVSRETWATLFKPEDVLVGMDGGHQRGYMISGMPKTHCVRFDETKNWRHKTEIEFKPGSSRVTLNLASWKFDGQFRFVAEEISMEWPSQTSVARINDLDFYPLQYDDTGAREVLKERGKRFWMCRRKAYICYDLKDKKTPSSNAKPRFMVDYDTYRELHPNAPVFSSVSRDDIGDEDMDKDEPPGRGMEYLFPLHIDGFAIQDKKWRKLLVDHITPITWNEEAFKRLVLDDEAKELIQALIEVHMSSKPSADVIEGKGNGLLILLHGPPGTGKTLTAESVAELVKRPLYRVTCGDIGTDAEGVEAYLESVLYIGKIWGCVILIDEADVFLEERSLADLQRNALVSVFLRVLEYYDGILILTSNRVGTFDEAFRSRIKLALHYSSLTKAERRKVWRNFFKTLRDVQHQDVNFDDLEDHLDDLADIKLNGREIRNAISTASELATFRKQELTYKHIHHVIRIGGEFEKYLDKVRGETAEQRMIELGFR